MSIQRDTVQELINKEEQLRINELKEKADFISKNMGTQDLYNRINESVFVNYFLPFFIGQRHSDTWVIEWISIAGTPMLPVNVVDDVTKEVLYTVPGFLDTSSIINDNRNLSLGAIIERYIMIENNGIPMQSRAYLAKNLNEYEKAVTGDMGKNTINQWHYILQRYNLMPAEQQQAPTSQNNDLDDFIDG